MTIIGKASFWNIGSRRSRVFSLKVQVILFFFFFQFYGRTLVVTQKVYKRYIERVETNSYWLQFVG